MESSPSTIFPPTSPSFEFSFERTKGNKSQLKALIVQEAQEIHREYLANKTTSGSDGGASGGDGAATNESTEAAPQPKKRSISTGRPTHASSTASSAASSNVRPTKGRQETTRETRGAAGTGTEVGGGGHEDDDNASKHSYKSEITSSTQGTHNRTSTKRTTLSSRTSSSGAGPGPGPGASSGVGPGSRTGTSANNTGGNGNGNGIGYPSSAQQKKAEKDRVRARSTGRVHMSSKPLGHQVEIEERELPSALSHHQSQGGLSTESQQKMNSQRVKAEVKQREEDGDGDEEDERTRIPHRVTEQHQKRLGQSHQHEQVQSYHQVQSPSRKKTEAMHELEDEVFSKKAMSYLSHSQKTTESSTGTVGLNTNPTSRPYIPRRGAEESDEESGGEGRVGRGSGRGDLIGDDSGNESDDVGLMTNHSLKNKKQDSPSKHQHLPHPSLASAAATDSDNDSQSVDEVDLKLAQQYGSHQIRSTLPPSHLVGGVAVKDHSLSPSRSHQRGLVHHRHGLDSDDDDELRGLPEAHQTKSVISSSSRPPLPSSPHRGLGHTHGRGMTSTDKITHTAVGLDASAGVDNAAPPGATGAPGGGGAARKKGLTVPKSPQFSKMSWQRSRRQAEAQEREREQQQQQELKKKKSETGFLGPKPSAGDGRVTMEKKRSTSGLRSRPGAGPGGLGHDDHSDSHSSSHHETTQKTRKNFASNSTAASVSGGGGGASGGGVTRAASGAGGGNQKSGSSIGRLGRYYC
jgi:hypothetical protein